MEQIKRAEGILIDFDGVIAKQAVDRIILFVHKYINNKTPIEIEYIRAYIKSVACFPVNETINLIFSALGLQEDIDDFFTKFHEFDKKHGEFLIEKDFQDFIKFCDSNDLVYKIFSLASLDRINAIGYINGNHVYPLNNRSKANIGTFKDIEKEMNINLHNWLYIEDNPIALRTGKLAGLSTVMMLNNVYTEDDYNIFAKFIDYKVHTFSELQKIVLKSYL